MQRQTERTNKTKIKKALATYEAVINKIVIENNYIRSTEELDKYIKNDTNCSNADNYFKSTKKEGCVFRTADGLWWDIGRNATFSKAFVSFDKKKLYISNAINEIETDTFYFQTEFDENGGIRILDYEYGWQSGQNSMISNSRKVYNYIGNELSLKLCGEGEKKSCIEKTSGDDT